MWSQSPVRSILCIAPLPEASHLPWCRGRAPLGPHRPPLGRFPPPNRPLFLLARSFLNRDDIGIILINQCVAELIRHAVEAHTRSLPAVLEIPSKEHPYDAARDSVLRRARGMFTADDLR